MNSFTDYFKAALVHPVNWMVFGLFAVIGLVTFNPLFLILGAGWEAAWLAGAPMVPAFKESVDRKKLRDTQDVKEAIDAKTLKSLPPDVQARYNTMKSIAMSIREDFTKGTSASEIFLDQITGRVDDLLQRYLELLKAYDVYTRQNETNPAAALQDKLLLLDQEIADADDTLAEAKTRQRQILAQRLEKAVQAEKEWKLLGAQLETLEELIKLLQSQAVSMTQPEEMTSQLDSIIAEVEVTESTVSQLQSSAEAAFDKELEDAEQRKRLEP